MSIDITSISPELLAGVPVGVVILYKAWRMLKEDRSVDGLHNEQELFLKTVMEELRLYKEDNQKLLKDRLELSIKVARLETMIDAYLRILKKNNLLEDAASARRHSDENTGGGI